MKKDEVFEKVILTLNGSDNLGEAMQASIMALAYVIAKSDRSLDKMTYSTINHTLPSFVEHFRKEEAEGEAANIIDEIRNLLGDESISVETIVDKYIECETPELREELIEKLRERRIAWMESMKD